MLYESLVPQLLYLIIVVLFILINFEMIKFLKLCHRLLLVSYDVFCVAKANGQLRRK